MEEYLRNTAGLPPMPIEKKGTIDRSPTPPPAPKALLAPGTTAPAKGEPKEAPPAGEIPKEKALESKTVAAARNDVIYIGGRGYGREPTEFESRILAYKTIPAKLDAVRDDLVHAMVNIRKRQLTAYSNAIAGKDARPTGEFTDIRPDTVGGAKFHDEMKRVIRKAQDAIAAFGRENVRDELARQGADVGGAVMMAKADADAMKVKSTLVSSAEIAVKKIGVAWETAIMEMALKLRKNGLQGEALVEELEDQMNAAMEMGLKREAGNQLGQSYALGRAAEAMKHAAVIDRAVYSSLMDARACDVCRSLDGEEMDYGSGDYYDHLPPNPSCFGKDACRCVYIYVAAKPGEDVWEPA
jgi:hypothetical protein